MHDEALLFCQVHADAGGQGRAGRDEESMGGWGEGLTPATMQ